VASTQGKGAASTQGKGAASRQSKGAASAQGKGKGATLFAEGATLFAEGATLFAEGATLFAGNLHKPPTKFPISRISRGNCKSLQKFKQMCVRAIHLLVSRT